MKRRSSETETEGRAPLAAELENWDLPQTLIQPGAVATLAAPTREPQLVSLRECNPEDSVFILRGGHPRAVLRARMGACHPRLQGRSRIRQRRRIQTNSGPLAAEMQNTDVLPVCGRSVQDWSGRGRTGLLGSMLHEREVHQVSPPQSQSGTAVWSIERTGGRGALTAPQCGARRYAVADTPPPQPMEDVATSVAPPVASIICLTLSALISSQTPYHRG